MDRSKLYPYSEGAGFKGKQAEEIFSEISKNNTWIEKESVSGFGSSLEQTKKLRFNLPEVLRMFGIVKLLDLPCGDFNWMKETDLSGIEYTGGDIVKSVIDRNRSLFSSLNISFIHLDLMKGDLGDHDVLFCRDCLVHLSFSDIKRAIENIKRSNITYLMATTFPEEKVNKDVVTGGWRPLNMEIAPFHFPSPLHLLNEGCTEMDEVFKDKSLGIWRVDELEFKS